MQHGVVNQPIRSDQPEPVRVRTGHVAHHPERPLQFVSSCSPLVIQVRLPPLIASASPMTPGHHNQRPNDRPTVDDTMASSPVLRAWVRRSTDVQHRHEQVKHCLYREQDDRFSGYPTERNGRHIRLSSALAIGGVPMARQGCLSVMQGVEVMVATPRPPARSRPEQRAEARPG